MLVDSSMRFPTAKGNGITIDSSAHIQRDCVIEAPVKLGTGSYDVGSIGGFTYTNGNTTMIAVSSVGRFCSIAPNVTIGNYSHPTDLLTHNNIAYGYVDAWNENFHTIRYDDSEAVSRRHLAGSLETRRSGIIIGNDIWIGQSAIILKGVAIGDGAIIGAGAVVSKDVAPYTIVGGVPARLIRPRFPEHVVERLLSVRWWRYGADILKGVDFSNIETVIRTIEERIEGGFPLYHFEEFEFKPSQNSFSVRQNK